MSGANQEEQKKVFRLAMNHSESSPTGLPATPVLAKNSETRLPRTPDRKLTNIQDRVNRIICGVVCRQLALHVCGPRDVAMVLIQSN